MSDQKQRAQELLNQLHSKWKPHEGQKGPRAALFKELVKDIFIEAGRNWGKTEFVSYVLWRFAILFPGSENYYFAPYMKQAREIIWASKRMQGFGPLEWVNRPNDSQMRLPFKNNSFIKCDGSDNYEAYRGVKPKGVIIYDEFKDFRPEFHEAFDPNRAAHDAPLIIIGTPPESDGQFFAVADEFKSNTKKRYFWAPSDQNPYLNKDWLNNKKAELYSRGDGDIWEREYMAKRVKGGKRSIFPMFSRAAHTKPKDEILKELSKDLYNLEWYTIADPGTITVFAGVVMAINPYTRRVYILDEIYQRTEAETTTSIVCPMFIEKEKALLPNAKEDRWFRVCDEAGAWFISEALDRYELSFTPTNKALHKKENGINLIRDLFLSNQILIADECVNTIWEIENYIKDASGKIPKVNDHILDCIAEGQLVDTPNGCVPIEALSVGDFVSTRSGPKKITDTWSKGVRPCVELKFTNGSSIVCTENHLILTHNGWKRAVDIDTNDIVCNQARSVWSSMESFLSGIQSLKIETCKATLGRGIENLFYIFTGMFGKKIMAQFQTAFTFITKITTPQTMTLQTLSAFQNANILAITTPTFLLRGPQREQKTLIESDRSLPRGTEAKPEKNGIESITKKTQSTYCISEKKKPVRGAKRPSWALLGRMRFIATEIVRWLRDEKNVVRLASRCTTHDRRVFDLTVNDAHEFFVGGVLVHNCTRYGLAAANYSIKTEARILDLTTGLDDRDKRIVTEQMKEEQSFSGNDSLEDSEWLSDLDEYGESY